MRCLLKGSSVLFLCSASMLFGWSVDGTVKSKEGALLSGVAVTVRDSASFSQTTGADGKFLFQGTSSIQGLNSQNSPRFQWKGDNILLNAASGEKLDVSVYSVSGSVLWQKNVVMAGGSQLIALPPDIAQSVKYVQVRSEGNSSVHASETPRALAVMAPMYPTLDFRKSGYADTSFTMTSESMNGVSIVMRSTAVQPVTCPSPVLSSGNTTKKITIGGKEREYILHVPTKYDGTKPVPLVLDFHGIGGDGKGQHDGTTYRSLTDNEGVISLYPTGLVSAYNNAKGWNYGPCCTTGDDVGFAREMVKEVSKIACIDPSRVYATGFSNGGGMALQLACEAADVFAAIAPAAFDLSTYHDTSCVPSRPISVISFRGTSDFVVKYPGEYSAVVPGMPIDFKGAVGSFNKWGSLNQCTGSPSAADANGCQTYSNCAAGTQVVLCTKQGGQHEQGNGSVGWPFLKKFTKP